jgi:hypothetical protein
MVPYRMKLLKFRQFRRQTTEAAAWLWNPTVEKGVGAGIVVSDYLYAFAPCRHERPEFRLKSPLLQIP